MKTLYELLYLIATLSGLHYFVRLEPASVWLCILSFAIVIANFINVFRQKVIHSEIIKSKNIVFTIIQLILCVLILLSLKSVIAIHLIVILNFLVLLLVVPTVLWSYGLTYIVNVENAVVILMVLKTIELMIWVYKVKKLRTKTVV